MNGNVGKLSLPVCTLHLNGVSLCVRKREREREFRAGVDSPTGLGLQQEGREESTGRDRGAAGTRLKQGGTFNEVFFAGNFLSHHVGKNSDGIPLNQDKKER